MPNGDELRIWRGRKFTPPADPSIVFVGDVSGVERISGTGDETYNVTIDINEKVFINNISFAWSMFPDVPASGVGATVKLLRNEAVIVGYSWKDVTIYLDTLLSELSFPLGEALNKGDKIIMEIKKFGASQRITHTPTLSAQGIFVR